MKKTLAALALCCATSLCAAQAKVPEAKQLADMLIESNWPTVQATFPMLFAGMEANLKRSMTENSAKTFREKLAERLTRENISRVYAESLSQQFDAEEISEIATFFRSPTGKKYLRSNSDVSKNAKMMLPVVREACESAAQDLSGNDKVAMSSVCACLANTDQQSPTSKCKS